VADDKKYFLLLCLILTFKSMFMIGVVCSSLIGLGPDEAQYWTWSQDLAWGYYSKPPAIAWQIWAGTQIFGNIELGVRFFAVVISFLISVSLYFLARACNLTARTAFWTGTAFALTPLGLLSSILAITDGGLVLFWTLACLVVARALTQDKTPNYIILGFIIFAGALFKWLMYVFWPLLLLGMFFFPRLRSRSILAGVFISLLGLIPSIIWNASHDWATFRHVARTVEGGESADIGTTALSQGNVIEFLGAQAALLSPILFILLAIALYTSLRYSKKLASQGVAFCGFMFIAPFLAYTIWSAFMKMQGNWMDYIYPAGLVFLCWYACERISYGKLWLKIGLGLSLALSLIAIAIPYIQAFSLMPQAPIPYRSNPFRHNVGWGQLQKELTLAGYDPKEHFLFGDKYQMSSILSFYSPSQKRAYFLNLQGIRKNQFSYWPSMAQEQIGHTGFLF
jgi:4-amino-4-deoxy-L-arabinose transferase-like glycosyltransferase